MPKTPENSEYKISYKFQERLIQLIDEHDYKTYEFAELACVSKGIIGRATVYGIIPSVRTLIKIANFFNVSLLYLLGEVDHDDFYASDHPTTFQTRLEELSQQKNISYSKIAHDMPFPRSFFFDWQRKGTLPSLDYLIAIAEYFDVSVDYLLGRTEETHN